MTLEAIKTALDIIVILGGSFLVKKVIKWYTDYKLKQEQHRSEVLNTLKYQNTELAAIKYQLYPNGKLSMFDKLTAGLARLEAGQINVWELLDLAVWMSDKDGRVTFVTNSLCQMIGCTVNDVMDNSWVNRVIDADRNKIFTAWTASIETAGEFNQTYTYKKSDGMYQTVTATAVHNKGSDGKVMSSVGRFQRVGKPFKKLKIIK